MKTRLGLITAAAAAIGSGALFAQPANFTGVWKANPDKSKFAGPPPSSYIMLIDQQGSKVTAIVGSAGMHGEERSSFTYDLTGKATMNSMRGAPLRTEVAVDGSVLTLTSKVAGRPVTVSETYTLAPDGNTLTINTTTVMNGKERQQTLVLEKQPESMGDALRKPEETAAVRFKNVQILKNVPASQFMEIMGYFTLALGVQCDFCHVQSNFSADEKPAKGMARKMLTMTHNINEQTFGGNQEVHCYTCHQGRHEPQSSPAFQ